MRIRFPAAIAGFISLAAPAHSQQTQTPPAPTIEQTVTACYEGLKLTDSRKLDNYAYQKYENPPVSWQELIKAPIYCTKNRAVENGAVTQNECTFGQPGLNISVEPERITYVFYDKDDSEFSGWAPPDKLNSTDDDKSAPIPQNVIDAARTLYQLCIPKIS